MLQTAVHMVCRNRSPADKTLTSSIAAMNLAGYSNSPTSLKNPSQLGNPNSWYFSKKTLPLHHKQNYLILYSWAKLEQSTWGET